MNVKPATCPTSEVLFAFSTGNLQRTEMSSVAGHLKGCAQCRQLLISVRNASTNPPPGPTPAVPAWSSGAVPVLTPVVVPTAASPVPGLPPELVNHPKFRILGELGRGGMGVVYKAEHRLMEKLVALKVISRTVLTSSDSLARFQQEVARRPGWTIRTSSAPWTPTVPATCICW